MRRWPAVGLALALLWLFVRGVSLTPVRLAEEFLIGLAVGVPVAYLFRRFYNREMNAVGALRALPLAVVYIVIFLWELVTANLDVAYRVLHPSLPIEPDVFEVPLRVQSDLAITTIANSITLTPGTLTMDYDAERNALYVHTIAGADRESIVSPIRTWEGYALRIFAEPLSPGDPVPDPDGPEPDRVEGDDAGGENDGD